MKQKIFEKKQTDHREKLQKIYDLGPPEWKEEVKRFEKQFLEFTETNKTFQPHCFLFEKWLENLKIIKVTYWPACHFSILDRVFYEEIMTKWDALQVLRRKRKYAQEMEKQAFEQIT